MKEIYIPECDSLMSVMRQAEFMNIKDEIIIFRTDFQTAGKGQHDHHWESEKGSNLLLGVIIKDIPFHPNEHYKILQHTALATRHLIEEIIEKNGIGDDTKAYIKAPNDIYVNTSKIAGMLIEHDITGEHINSTRIGIGINVNQTYFTSDAPNPISLASLTKKTYDIETIFHQWVHLFTTEKYDTKEYEKHLIVF